MKAKNYDVIVNEINNMIKNGQAGSLLQKLEFDFSVKTQYELGNYLVILLTLIEDKICFSAASNLLLRRTLHESDKFGFLKSGNEIFEIIKDNKVKPYVGLSEIIRRLITTIIYKKEEDLKIISKWPSKEYFVKFNFDLLQEYLSEKNASSDTAIALLYGCIDFIDDDKVIHLNPDAMLLLKLNFTNNVALFRDYINNFIRFYYFGTSRVWDDGKLIVPEPFYKQIFKSAEGFIDFINQQLKKMRPDTANDKVYNDVKRFVIEYAKNGHVYYDRIPLDISLHKNLSRELLP